MAIVCTGSQGFLGQHLMSLIPSAYRVSSNSYDLRSELHVKALFENVGHVDTLYHLAATVGGIGLNQRNPGLLFYDNMKMGLNIIEAARRYEVGKIVFIGSTCSYPKFTSIPFNERDLFNGYPEETNAPYGIAKRALYTMLKAYKEQYGLKFAYVIPTNLYGPGDNFDENSSHVIPALIKKFLSSSDKVTIWGTGKATRDFLYVEDAARAIKLVGEKYEGALNIGSGQEFRISTLAYLIRDLTGYQGRIEYDTSKPDGQPRRCLDISRIKELGWLPEVGLKGGLERTIEYYDR